MCSGRKSGREAGHRRPWPENELAELRFLELSTSGCSDRGVNV